MTTGSSSLIPVGAGTPQNVQGVLSSMAMRHGLIAGATGTGKTFTLKVLAEGFSDLGIPVFLVDMKGDVSSLAQPGIPSDSISSRLNSILGENAEFDFHGYPVRFWDVFGENGIPVRAAVSDLGPLLLSRLLSLTPAQTGVLNIIFKAADDRGWKLIDLKDLRAMASWVMEERKALQETYGTISSASAGAIIRALTELENQSADQFFGAPDLNIADWFTGSGSQGTINILESARLGQNPLLYSTFLLWMLSELYEALPEAGDLARPKFVFFFDEAHMIFKDAPKALVDKITQVVRLIRSKGVSIWFITQNPSDLDDEILSQLQNRIQHALHAYTPADQKKLKAAAAGFRINPELDTLSELSALKTGEALVSFLDEEGAPSPVEKITILPPHSSFTALTPQQIGQICAQDPMSVHYGQAVDPYSASEALEEEKKKQEEKNRQEEEQAALEKQRKLDEKARQKEETARLKEEERQREKLAREREKKEAARSRTMQNSLKKASRSAARSIGRDVGKSITRGLLGSDNSTARRAAGNFAGNLVGDLFSSIFK